VFVLPVVVHDDVRLCKNGKQPRFMVMVSRVRVKVRIRVSC